MTFELRPVPKPRHKRFKKTAKQRGAVTKEVYQRAWERSGGRCERCRRGPGQVWTLDAAHVERRWKFGQDGVSEYDIVILCGPPTDSRTCHHWADHTREGRAWLLQKREEFKRKVTKQ